MLMSKMGDLINLRQARKGKARQTRDSQAAQNRVIFGTSKEAKAINQKRQAIADRHLDGQFIEKAGTHEPD
jgi:hypothetical protein